jgi:hypothetical protein
MSPNVDLHVELKEKDEDLKKAEEAHKEDVELAEKRAKELEDSSAALVACMQEAKVAIDAAFVKGGAESSELLPEADPAAFLAWLQAEVGQFSQLLDSVADFGAYGATLTIARSFQAAGCDHLKRLWWVNHNFPSIDDVRAAAEDRHCKNVVARFLMKF